MYQKPIAPRSIGGVLDDTIQLYKASFSRCVVPALMLGVVVILQVVYQSSIGAIGVPGMRATLGNAAGMVSRYSLSLIVVMVVELLLYGAMVWLCAAVAANESPRIGASLAAAARRWGALIGGWLVLAVVAAFGFIIALIPIFVGMALRHGGNPVDILMQEVPETLLACVLVIPTLYVLLRIMLFTVPIMSERQGPFESIATSWRLIGGNWWRATTVVFVIVLIIYVLSILAVVLVGAVAAVILGARASTPQGLLLIALWIGTAGGVVRCLVSPLGAAMMVVLYQDLTLRKGGGDLEARFGELPKG